MLLGEGLRDANTNEVVPGDTRVFRKVACLVATWKALLDVSQKSFGIGSGSEFQRLTVLGLLKTEMRAERFKHLKGLGSFGLGKHADLQIEMGAMVCLSLEAPLPR